MNLIAIKHRITILESWHETHESFDLVIISRLLLMLLDDEHVLEIQQLHLFPFGPRVPAIF